MAFGLLLLIAAGCTSANPDALTLAELRLLNEEFEQGGSEELLDVVADTDSLGSVATIVDDAVWHPPLGVAGGRLPAIRSGSTWTAASDRR